MSRCGCSPNPCHKTWNIRASNKLQKIWQKRITTQTHPFHTNEVNFSDSADLWVNFSPRSACTKSSFITRSTPKLLGPSLYSAKLKWKRDFNQFSLVHPCQSWKLVRRCCVIIGAWKNPLRRCALLLMGLEFGPSSEPGILHQGFWHCQTIEDQAHWPHSRKWATRKDGDQKRQTFQTLHDSSI